MADPSEEAVLKKMGQDSVVAAPAERDFAVSEVSVVRGNQMFQAKRAFFKNIFAVGLAILASPSALAAGSSCPAHPSSCIAPATDTCPQREAVGPMPADHVGYNSRNSPTGRAIVFGSVTQLQDRFGFYDFQVGNMCTRCQPPAAPTTACSSPTWQQDFVQLPAAQSSTALVAIWSDSAAGWDSTTIYTPNGDSKIGAVITKNANPPTGYPSEITPFPIPGGSTFGGYFLLDVAQGKNASSQFTYRSSFPNTIKFKVQAKVTTDLGPLLPEDKGMTVFKPAVAFTSAPTTTIAGACSGAMTVSTQDGNGNSLDTLPANKVSLSLHATPGFTYLDPACAYPSDNVGIQSPVPPAPTGLRPATVISPQRATFYFKIQNTYPSFPVSLDYIDTDGTKIFTVPPQNQTVIAAAPIGLKVAVPGSAAQNTCSSAIHISFVDKFGNEASFSGSKQITVGGSHFFNSADCSGAAISSFTATQGMTSKNVYMRESTPGTVKVVAGGASLQGDVAEIRVMANGLLAKAADLPHAQNMARRLYRRIAGTPLLDDSLLGQMSNLLVAGKALDAADLATRDPGFYNVTLKQFFTKMSNRLEDPSEPFSDFVATAIGTVRDNRDAREFLTGDKIYVGKSFATSDVNACANSDVYKGNSHYTDLETRKVDLSTELVPVKQCVYNTDSFDTDTPIPTDDGGGLATTHKWGEQHVVAGTNRRAMEFMMKQFNCLTMTQMSDNSVADWHVRRDVDRAPGNDPRTYETSCRGCHAMMDSAAGAFAFHDWYPRPMNMTGMEDSRLFLIRGGYGGNAVMPKLNQNFKTFPAGWISSDNSWALNLTEKQQKLLGVDEGIPTSGNGVHSLGRALANSASFRSCMATRAFELVCLRAHTVDDAGSISDLANYFADTGYNMRSLIERAAVLGPCLGGGETQ